MGGIAINAGDEAARPTVDVLVVNYNGSRWIDGFARSLERSTYPFDRLRLVVVDNASTDGSDAAWRARAAELPFAAEIVDAGGNLGFAGGYGVAFRHARADFHFVVNQDTEVDPEAIGLLVDRLVADPKAGIAEARQAPREHPKYYDPFTGETSWCSGACMMVRPAAMADAGGGFDHDFFMYAEDVDLSWRMWLSGWKCVYVPEAEVVHFTEDLDPKRKPTLQHYYSMRNGACMRLMYGSWGEIAEHYLAMVRVATIGRAPWWHRVGTVKGLFASLWMLPKSLRKRTRLQAKGRHPWVTFNGWDYGRNLRDLAVVDRLETPNKVSDATYAFEDFKRAALERLEESPNLPFDVEPGLPVAGRRRPALVAAGRTTLEFAATVPEEAELVGAAVTPSHPAGIVGRFAVRQDGREIWSAVVADRPDPVRRFAVPLESSGGKPSTIELCFDGRWGYWTDLGVNHTYQVMPTPVVVNREASISVVVPTYNRAEGVRRVVERLLDQDMACDGVELLLVDSKSSDHTPAVLAELARHPRVRVARCETKGASAARNMGLDMARNELVVLMDDDILVRRDFLSRLWATHVRLPDRVLLTKIVAPWQGLIDPFQRFLHHADEVNIYDFKDPDDVPADYFFTGCIAAPREVLGETRFDENYQRYGVEDIDFGVNLLRGGAKMAFADHVEVWHEYYPEFDYFVRKQRAAGYSLGYFLDKKPWRAGTAVFGNWYYRANGLLRLAVLLSQPLRRLAEIYERVKRNPSPVNRFLRIWYKVALRSEKYEGLCDFRREKANNPPAPPASLTPMPLVAAVAQTRKAA